MSHFLFDNDLNENLDSLDYEIDIDNADIMNYKGYFVENEEEEEQKFFEYGAHFPYKLLYYQLEYLKIEREEMEKEEKEEEKINENNPNNNNNESIFQKLSNSFKLNTQEKSRNRNHSEVKKNIITKDENKDKEDDKKRKKTKSSTMMKINKREFDKNEKDKLTENLGFFSSFISKLIQNTNSNNNNKENNNSNQKNNNKYEKKIKNNKSNTSKKKGTLSNNNDNNKNLIPNSIKAINYISGFKKNLNSDINNNLKLKNITSRNNNLKNPKNTKNQIETKSKNEKKENKKKLTISTNIKEPQFKIRKSIPETNKIQSLLSNITYSNKSRNKNLINNNLTNTKSNLGSDKEKNIESLTQQNISSNNNFISFNQQINSSKLKQKEKSKNTVNKLIQKNNKNNAHLQKKEKNNFHLKLNNIFQNTQKKLEEEIKKTLELKELNNKNTNQKRDSVNIVKNLNYSSRRINSQNKNQNPNSRNRLNSKKYSAKTATNDLNNRPHTISPNNNNDKLKEKLLQFTPNQIRSLSKKMFLIVLKKKILK